jgi:hypothetical protein
LPTCDKEENRRGRASNNISRAGAHGEQSNNHEAHKWVITTEAGLDIRRSSLAGDTENCSRKKKN